MVDEKVINTLFSRTVIALKAKYEPHQTWTLEDTKTIAAEVFAASEFKDKAEVLAELHRVLDTLWTFPSQPQS